MSSPGFELLFGSVKPQLKSAQDALICVFHWELVANGFKCIGIGEESEQDGISEDSEMLPPHWNDKQDHYAIRYRCSSNKNPIYVFKVICCDGDLMLHLMNVKDNRITTMNVRTAEYTSETDMSSVKKAFKNLEELTKNFKKEIIEPMLKESKPSSSKSGEASSSQQRQQQERSRLQEEDPLRVPPRHMHRPPPGEWTEQGDPLAIGRGDLDPFARGQGAGMLFDPMRGGRPQFGPDPNAGLPGNLPRGSIPPGARFDPFGPPGMRPQPDPDHLPPPGYDDMFM